MTPWNTYARKIWANLLQILLADLSVPPVGNEIQKFCVGYSLPFPWEIAHTIHSIFVPNYLTEKGKNKQIKFLQNKNYVKISALFLNTFYCIKTNSWLELASIFVINN